MKVSELTAAQLDYWVAKAEGITHPRAMREMAPGFVMVPYESEDDEGPITRFRAFEPSSSWTDGGPIIEREHIKIEPMTSALWCGEKWIGTPGTREDKFAMAYGDTPLIAAMRTFVASKYGDEVPDTENA